MKKKIVLSLISVLIIALVYFLILDKGNEDVIIIGAAMPLSGDGAIYGVPQRNAAELAILEINENGGLLGKKVVLDAQDDQANPTLAVNVARYFVSNKNVVGVIGFPNSGNAIAAAKIFMENNMPYIASSPTNPKLTQLGYKNVFRFAPTDDMQGISVAEFIYNRLGVNEIVILNDNQAYGNGLASQVKNHFEELGGKILLFDNIVVGQKDYRNILTKVKTLKPKVVFYGGMLEEGAKLVKQAEEIRLNTNFVFGDGCFDEKFKELSGTDCKNVFISFLAPPWSEIPTAKQFVEKYKAKFGQDVPPFAPYGYDATLVLLKAIEKNNSLNKGKIINQIRENNFIVKGVTGDIQFEINGQSKNITFYFYQFVNNNLKLYIK